MDKKFLNNFGLDPAHYVSSLSLSWDAMLKMTKVELDLIYNNKVQTFIESGLRGRISYIANRYAKANNPHMESYDPNKKTTYNIYLDKNNLYGWAMSQPLPYADFRWKFKFSRKDLKRVINDTERGAILEVDPEYPKELHDSHDDYPLAPEKIIVKPEMRYKYCQDLKNKYSLPNGKVSKLVPNLMNKKNYIIYYKNLDLYLKLGMKLTKIHKAVEFKEKSWVKKYIKFNTEQRKIAKSKSEKILFKLMDNSVSSKTIENVRN